MNKLKRARARKTPKSRTASRRCAVWLGPVNFMHHTLLKGTRREIDRELAEIDAQISELKMQRDSPAVVCNDWLVGFKF